jgi:hypothetical protein
LVVLFDEPPSGEATVVGAIGLEEEAEQVGLAAAEAALVVVGARVDVHDI